MSALSGAGVLTKLALRRDRVSLPLWVVGLAGFTTATTALWVAQYHNNEANLIQDVRIAATSPGIRMLGLASGASVGGYAMVRDYLLVVVLAALMSIFTVVRHTRQSEETGRAELIGAAVVGRQAGLAAALIVAACADAALAVLVAVGMIATGQPVGGSFAAGAAIAGVGIAFAGIAAVTTQLASTTRGASGLAAAALGVGFLFSGIGNVAGDVDVSGLRVSSAWPSWLSPIGWGQQMRPFGGNHWWLLCLPFALFAASIAAAVVLSTRRDFGRGLAPQHPGRSEAGRLLRSSLGLAWHLQRGALLGWAVAMLGFGLVFGGLMEQFSNATGSTRDWYTRVGGSAQILDAYRASVMAMAAVAAAIYIVQVLLRMRAEETTGTLEPILATSVSRLRWVVGYALTALLGSIVLLLVFAVGTGLTGGAVVGDVAGEVGTLAAASLVQLPGILVMGAAVIALTGAAPHAASTVSWAFLIWSVIAGPLFGVTLKLPQWVQDLSPFTHVPKAPAVPVTAWPMVGLTMAIVALVATGLVALRRRDLLLPA